MMRMSFLIKCIVNFRALLYVTLACCKFYIILEEREYYISCEIRAYVLLPYNCNNRRTSIIYIAMQFGISNLKANILCTCEHAKKGVLYIHLKSCTCNCILYGPLTSS